jgi:glycosyltransferase involved in cell wall biosynthesis
MPFGKSIPLVAAINRFFLDRPIGKFVRRKGFARPMVWTYHPYMLTAAPERGPLVYHCVDDTGAAPGVDKDIFDTAERALLAQADVVFTTSLALQKKCAALNANTRYFPNVADAGHFGRAFTVRQLPRDIGAIASPRLGFHGVLTDFKVDFELLLKVAASRRDWHLVLIGEEREGQANATAAALRRQPNVHFLGYRPYAQLPEYLRGFDVGLLPFADNAFTRSIFPMKLHEYLAAGVPVVSTSATYASPQMRHVLVGQTPEAFIAAVEAQLRNGRLTGEEAREALGPNTWGERLTQMLDIVAVHPASKR